MLSGRGLTQYVQLKVRIGPKSFPSYKEATAAAAPGCATDFMVQFSKAYLKKFCNATCNSRPTIIKLGMAYDALISKPQQHIIYLPLLEFEFDFIFVSEADAD